MPDHFITKFGNRIDFVPGYFERNIGYTKFLTEARIQESLATGGIVSSGFLASEVVTFSKIISFMAKFGLPGRFNRGVDLGGAEGTLIRLFRASGVVQESSNVDLVDYSSAVSEKTFDDFMEHARAPRKFTPKMQQSARKTKVAFDYFAEQPLETGLITNFPKPPSLDHAHWMNLLDLTGQYDLVTSVACLDHISMNTGLAKVRSLLAPKGVFIGLIQMWWWLVNTTGLLGHFPYAAQRLTHDDLERYYATHCPEMLEVLRQRYSYFHEGAEHPTPQDWFAAAKIHGLRPVAIDRIIPTGHSMLAETPAQLFQETWFDYREVLRDIGYIKPDVSVEDLMTSHILVAMVAD